MTIGSVLVAEPRIRHRHLRRTIQHSPALRLGSSRAGRSSEAPRRDARQERSAPTPALATYLAFMVDQISLTYDSSFTSWVPTGEFSRSTFPRQAIAMSLGLRQIRSISR